MKTVWEKPILCDLQVEETKGNFHYHCGMCGAVVKASIIDSAPVVDDLTQWTCPSCGAKDVNYGGGCTKDHPITAVS